MQALNGQLREAATAEQTLQSRLEGVKAGAASAAAAAAARQSDLEQQLGATKTVAAQLRDQMAAGAEAAAAAEKACEAHKVGFGDFWISESCDCA